MLNSTKTFKDICSVKACIKYTAVIIFLLIELSSCSRLQSSRDGNMLEGQHSQYDLKKSSFANNSWSSWANSKLGSFVGGLRKNAVLSAVFLAGLGQAEGGSNPYFLKAFGGPHLDFGRSIIETSNGDFVLTGYTDSYGAGFSDIFVSKLSSNGTLFWTKTLGGPHFDFGSSIIETIDGNLVLTGSTFSYGTGFSDIFVSKLSSNGSLLWAKTLGGDNHDHSQSVIEVAGGDLVIAGYTNSYGLGGNDILICKLSSNGSLLWTKTLGGTDNDQGYSIVGSMDGNMFLIGNTASYGPIKILVSKLSSNGSLLWAKTLVGSYIDFGQTITKTSDGNLVLTGQTPNCNAENHDILVGKLSSEGRLLWAKSLRGPGSSRGYSIIEATDGNLVLTGQTPRYGPEIYSVFVSKLSSNGHLLWTKTLGGVNSDEGYSIIETSNGDFALTGYTGSYGAGSMDILVSKLTKETMEDCTTLDYLNSTDITKNILVSNVTPTLLSISLSFRDVTDIISISSINPIETTVCLMVDKSKPFSRVPIPNSNTNRGSETINLTGGFSPTEKTYKKKSDSSFLSKIVLIESLFVIGIVGYNTCFYR